MNWEQARRVDKLQAARVKEERERNPERGRALHGIPKVQLEDILDVRQYIGGIISRRWATLPPDEQDELALEAIAVIYDLHRHHWRPPEQGRVTRQGAPDVAHPRPCAARWRAPCRPAP